MPEYERQLVPPGKDTEMKIDGCSRVVEDKRVRVEGYDVASPLSFDDHT